MEKNDNNTQATIKPTVLDYNDIRQIAPFFEGKEKLVTVSDTGIGIPFEHQSRVFERFYRVDKSHSRQLGGTGLGLSIVKHAARLHKARLELRSTPDVGTTITIRFPDDEEREPGENKAGEPAI